MRELDGLRTLTVVVLTSDGDFRRAVAAVCLERGHAVLCLESLGRLPACGSGCGPSVLLLDGGAAQTDGLRVAATVSATHPGLQTVVACIAPRLRSTNGFRLVDRRRSAESIVDEVELAHIGIPAFVEEPLRRFLPADLAGMR